MGIVLAADQIDVDYGTIALAKFNDKTVREFAQRMVPTIPQSKKRDRAGRKAAR
ncbi:MAG: hypothetical protein JO108_11255 [Acidobacteriaceae bacterium]|nr:hypothetical protein [Acidobacteriaceae bacterium]